MTPQSSRIASYESVNKAFSRQSAEFDATDNSNPILQDMRAQVYAHVENYLGTTPRRILELNAGTGIDARYFVSLGHSVHATDLSDGMIRQITEKMLADTTKRLTCEQISYDRLDELSTTGFDYVFSNFGGLNCIPDLQAVTSRLPRLLNKGAYITWVVMPRICPWELAGIFRGHFRNSFRRFSPNGVIAHLEGEHFRTWYHSRRDIIRAFGNRFRLVGCEGLASLSPQPHQQALALRRPGLYRFLRSADRAFRHGFPFDRWADHIIITFQFIG